MNLMNNAISPVIISALKNNTAYLSVMLKLLDGSYIIPEMIKPMVESELDLIEINSRASSEIFTYDEDYTQYTPRGHYTRSEILENYFKAMMYAGRMSFLTQSPKGGMEMGIDHTRRVMLLVSSFNTSTSTGTTWDLWDKLYELTTFYVGESDDLTVPEYYSILKNHSIIDIEDLEDEYLLKTMIDEIKEFRDPKINSMFIFESYDHENVTKGFRLMGQRFTPDAYIFQELVHKKTKYRAFPTGLDILSVFGSARAEYLLQFENESYPNYGQQIQKLRSEFGNLTEYEIVENP